METDYVKNDGLIVSSVLHLTFVSLSCFAMYGLGILSKTEAAWYFSGSIVGPVSWYMLYIGLQKSAR